jgi:hypothetical protein
MLCLLEMKAAEPDIMFSTETDRGPRRHGGEEGSSCNVFLLHLFHLSLHQAVAVVVPTNLFLNLLGAPYGDGSGTTGIPFFGHTFPIGPVSGSSNFGHSVQIAVCVLYVGSSLLVCHKSDHDDDTLWKNQP